MPNYHLTINDQDGERTAMLKTTVFRVSGLQGTAALPALGYPAPAPTVFRGSEEQGSSQGEVSPHCHYRQQLPIPRLGSPGRS